MEAPKGCPLRDEIVDRYLKTLAMKSMYSISTKYYYAFGCDVPENFTNRIKLLPNVKWVLSDSYLIHGESSYRGEPFIDGELVPYDDKYHRDWIEEHNDDKHKSLPHSKKSRRKLRKKTKSKL